MRYLLLLVFLLPIAFFLTQASQVEAAKPIPVDASTCGIKDIGTLENYSLKGDFLAVFEYNLVPLDKTKPTDPGGCVMPRNNDWIYDPVDGVEVVLSKFPEIPVTESTTLQPLPNTPNTCLLYTSPSPRD